MKTIEERRNEKAGNNRHRPDLQVCISAGNSDKRPVVKDASHPLPSIPDMKLDHILVLDQTCPKQTQRSLKANAIPGTPQPENTPASLICLLEVYQTFCHCIPKQSCIPERAL